MDGYITNRCGLRHWVGLCVSSRSVVQDASWDRCIADLQRSDCSYADCRTGLRLTAAGRSTVGPEITDRTGATAGPQRLISPVSSVGQRRSPIQTMFTSSASCNPPTDTYSGLRQPLSKRPRLELHDERIISAHINEYDCLLCDLVISSVRCPQRGSISAFPLYKLCIVGSWHYPFGSAKTIKTRQEAHLSQRDRAMFRFIEYFAKSLVVTQGHWK